MGILMLLALALAPGVCIILYIYLKDRHEKEPVRLLAWSFLFGFVSVLVTLAISLPIDFLVPIEEEDLSSQALHAFLLVAFVEESSKFLFVRGVLYHYDHFNEPFDGIVYSVMVGMGFATLENVFYVIDGGYETALLRMFTAVPAHATFAVIMGFYIGKAKFERRGFTSLYGLLGATVLHGAYDYFLFINFIPGMGLGATVSLVLGVVLSLRAIRIHQAASPFRSIVDHASQSPMVPPQEPPTAGIGPVQEPPPPENPVQ